MQKILYNVHKKKAEGPFKKAYFMGKIFGFLREVYGEMQKVVWPSRKQTLQYTVLVIVFSLAMAIFLGAADYGLLKVFEKVVAQ